MNLICTLGSTVYDWGWPKNDPYWTKNGQTWQACQRSKVAQKGRKGTKIVIPSVFDNLGPFRANEFLPHMDKVGFGGGAPEQKINIFNHMKKYKFQTDPSSEFQTRSSSELVS